MHKQRESLMELENRLQCLYVALYQTCGTMPLSLLENLCRRIHMIESRINSFKGGIYGNNK